MNLWTKVFFITLLWAGTSALTAQQDINQQIQQLISQKETDFHKIDKVLYWAKYDSVKMKKMAELSQKNNYPEGEIYAYNMLGKIYRISTNYPKAIFYHQKAYNKAKEIDNLYYKIYSLNMMGVVYRRMDAVKSALEYHNKALELAKNAPRKNKEIVENIAISHNSIGNIYLLLQRDDMAYLHFSKALEIEKKFNNKLGLAINYQNIGSILERKGDLEEALNYYRKSLWYNQQIDSKVGKIICNTSIGSIYLKKHQPGKALEIVEPSDIERQGIIQSFEFSFELAWKTMKDFLESQGVTCLYPREVLKTAFQYQILDDGEIWLEMLGKRNLLAHTYDEMLALECYRLIKDEFTPCVKKLVVWFQDRLQHETD